MVFLLFNIIDTSQSLSKFFALNIMIFYVDVRRNNIRVSLFDNQGKKIQDLTTRNLGLSRRQRVFKDYFVVLLRTFLRRIKIKRYKHKQFVLKFKGVFRKRWASILVVSFLKSRNILLLRKFVRVLKIPHNGCRLKKKRR